MNRTCAALKNADTMTSPRLPVPGIPPGPLDSRGAPPSWDLGLVLGFGCPPLGEIAGNRRYGPKSVFSIPRLAHYPREVVTICAASCASGFTEIRNWSQAPLYAPFSRTIVSLTHHGPSRVTAQTSETKLTALSLAALATSFSFLRLSLNPMSISSGLKF